MIPTLNFLAPSLHPNTLLDISIPLPSSSSTSIDPVVKHLAIKHGDHQALGNIKRLVQDSNGHVVVVDDTYKISTLSINDQETREDQDQDQRRPNMPQVINQYTSSHRPGDTWIGHILTPTGTISGLTSGQLTYLPTSTPSSVASTSPSTSSSSNSLTRTVPSPLLALSSDQTSSNFALAGKEVDVSIWDIERAFSSPTPSTTNSTNGPNNGVLTGSGKRKKGELEQGEIWRAKNMPNNSLSLRPPNHHLSLCHLPLLGPTHLVSGTKNGAIRTYDIRQRKPVNEWKVAREGGVGCVVQGQAEHEVFFSDHANFLGCVDIRSGRLLYSYPSMTSTPHHLLPIPSMSSTTPNNTFNRYNPFNVSTRSDSLNPTLGLASISSDATLRIHSTIPPKISGQKGNNNNGNGRKAKIEGMVGGVGVGNAIWRGWGEMEEIKALNAEDAMSGRGGKGGKGGKGGENGGDGDTDGEDENEDDEEVWENMSQVEDEDEDESESEDDEPLVKSKRSKK